MSTLSEVTILVGQRARDIEKAREIFVAEIRGSHSGIVGLPLCETALLLRQFGYSV